MLLDLRRRRQKKVLPSEHQKVLLIVLCFWFSTQIIPPGGNFAPYCELDLSPSLDISSISRLRGRYGYGYGYALLDYLPGGGGSTLRLFASSPLRPITHSSLGYECGILPGTCNSASSSSICTAQNSAYCLCYPFFCIFPG